jgi:hypothetical protein
MRGEFSGRRSFCIEVVKGKMFEVWTGSPTGKQHIRVSSWRSSLTHKRRNDKAGDARLSIFDSTHYFCKETKNCFPKLGILQ